MHWGILSPFSHQGRAKFSCKFQIIKQCCRAVAIVRKGCPPVEGGPLGTALYESKNLRVLVIDEIDQQFQIQKHQPALSRSCGGQPDSVRSVKTTRQLSKINPHAGGVGEAFRHPLPLREGKTPTHGFFKQPQLKFGIARN
jgi:hypothetical protein